jgi:hypothetical protein
MYEERLVLKSPGAPKVQSSQGVLDVGREGRERRDSEDGSDGDTDREEDNWRTAEALFGDTVVDEERLYSKAYVNGEEDNESQSL